MASADQPIPRLPVPPEQWDHRRAALKERALECAHAVLLVHGCAAQTTRIKDMVYGPPTEYGPVGGRQSLHNWWGDREGILAAAVEHAALTWTRILPAARNLRHSPSTAAAAVFLTAAATTADPEARPRPRGLHGCGWLTAPAIAHTAMGGKPAEAAQPALRRTRDVFTEITAGTGTEAAAAILMSLLQGAVIAARTEGSPQPLRDAADAARDIVLGWRR